MSQLRQPPEPQPVELDRDVFLRTLIRELSGTLEDVVGLEEASGFVSIVGQRMGDWINAEYERVHGDDWTVEQVANTLVDLKRRIQGDFAVESIDQNRIVLRNKACPFGDKVIGRPSMCMMTSNVFGSITADRLGYARVELQETIAEGATGCHVVVHLQPSAVAASEREREYFGAGAPDDAATSDVALDAATD